MNIAFGDLKIHYESIKPQIDTAVARVLASGWYIMGPELERFEQQFAEYLGIRYVVGCASGTEAIYLALTAAGVKQGDEVITVAHTAVPTISAISMTGARPVFVDIDPVTCLMDVGQVASKVSAKTKAILPVHLYGATVELDPLMKLGKEKGIAIVEDVAQATGAVYQGKLAGTIGNIGAFSFYPSKNLGAFGDGGAVCTNSPTAYERLLRLRNYGQSKRYYHDEIGINSRLDEMQAAILGAQLPFLTEWNSRRRQIALRYTAALGDLVAAPVAPVTQLEERQHVYHLYVIQTNDRDGLQNYLTQRGVGTLIHYPIPAHLQKAYGYLGYKQGDLPASEFVAARILSLPLYPELTDAQADTVIDNIRQYIKLNPAARAAHTDFNTKQSLPTCFTPMSIS